MKKVFISIILSLTLVQPTHMTAAAESDSSSGLSEQITRKLRTYDRNNAAQTPSFHLPSELLEQMDQFSGNEEAQRIIKTAIGNGLAFFIFCSNIVHSAYGTPLSRIYLELILTGTYLLIVDQLRRTGRIAFLIEHQDFLATLFGIIVTRAFGLHELSIKTLPLMGSQLLIYYAGSRFLMSNPRRLHSTLVPELERLAGILYPALVACDIAVAANTAQAAQFLGEDFPGMEFTLDEQGNHTYLARTCQDLCSHLSGYDHQARAHAESNRTQLTFLFDGLSATVSRIARVFSQLVDPDQTRTFIRNNCADIRSSLDNLPAELPTHVDRLHQFLFGPARKLLTSTTAVKNRLSIG